MTKRYIAVVLTCASAALLPVIVLGGEKKVAKGAGVGKDDGRDKVTLCHVPPGNRSKRHTLRVGDSAVDAHLDHGDFLGSCDRGRDRAAKDDGRGDDRDRVGKDDGRRAERQRALKTARAERDRDLARARAEADREGNRRKAADKYEEKRRKILDRYYEKVERIQPSF